MSTSLEPGKVEVVAPSPEVGVETSFVVPEEVPREALVEVTKNEYSIVGDGLYASVTAASTPQWLSSLIDGVIANGLATGLSDLATAQSSLATALSEVQVAKNTYAETVNIDATIEGIIATKVASLDASLAAANARVLSVESAQVSPELAAAMVAEQINASLNDGAIESVITDLRATVATNEATSSTSVVGLTSALVDAETGIEGNATASTNLYSYVGSDPDGNYVEGGPLAEIVALSEWSVNLDGYLDDPKTGVRYGAESEVGTNIKTAVDGTIESSFKYESLLTDINGHVHKAGFGLKQTAGGLGTDASPYSSEFWINAEKFRFTNEAAETVAPPFSITALAGEAPQVAFDGVVAFTNALGQTELGSVGAAMGKTKIDGGQITAGAIETAGLDTHIPVAGYNGTIMDKRGVRVYLNGSCVVKLGDLS